MIARSIAANIRGQLNKYPIVALTGPRQSGKTTLLRQLFDQYEYVSLESPDVRSFAQEDPRGFLKKYHQQVILDEVQRVPELFSYLQTHVDECKQMGQYIISGSQNFYLLESITQSLAGRVALFKLLPFDSAELEDADLLSTDWRELLVKGFYPAIYDRDLDSPVFYSNYLQTYIERDVARLTNIHDTIRFRNFLGLCAARHGQLLNLSNLANESGISQPTARSWLSILESSYLIFLLQPYFENFSKRIVKTPKLYFFDVGLVAYLIGIRQVEDLEDRSLAGSLFENMVIADMLKKAYHSNSLEEYWFWRDSAGHEVDLLTRKGSSFDVFEIKTTQSILPRHFEGMDYFTKVTGGKVKTRTLIYGGDDPQDRTDYRIRPWNQMG